MTLQPTIKKSEMVVDLAIVTAMGLFIFWFVIRSFGIQQIYGDDATMWAYYISLLSSSLPSFPNWSSCCFAGAPTAGITFLILVPAALIMKLGIDASTALNYSFLLFFILLGISVYYFARKVAVSRLISLALPVLVWSTNTQWNASIWGGSYDRFFSLPLMFFTLGAAYGLAKSANPKIKDYAWPVLAFTLVLVSNPHVSIPTVVLASGLVVLGSKSILEGIKRLSFISALAAIFSVWYTAPLIQHLLGTTEITFQPSFTVNEWQWLLFTGQTWEPTLNYAYVPLLVLISYFVLSLTRKKLTLFDRPRKALIVTAVGVFSYYFIEGWVPALWPYFYRFEATYDSVSTVGFMMIILFMALIGSIYEFGVVKGDFLRKRGVKIDTLYKIFATIFIIVILVDAELAIPSVATVDQIPLSQSLDSLVCPKGCAGASNFRLAVVGREVVRWFQLFNPNTQITDGRPQIVNTHPLYSSWFDTAVFYRGDLQSVQNIYFEDRPPILPQPYFLDTVSNVNSTIFWMDWFGANTGIIITNLSSDNYTQGAMNIYSSSPLLNTSSTSVFSKTYNSTFTAFRFTSQAVGPIASETNAPVIAFMMQGSGATQQWNLFLALLSYAGMGSSHVIPIMVNNTSEISAVGASALITDSSSYFNNTATINGLAQQGLRVSIIGADTVSWEHPIPNVSVIPDTLSAFVAQGATGSTNLMNQVLPGVSQLPAQIPIAVKWADSSTATANLSSGYKGFLWKETYASTWALQYTTANGTIRNLPFFSAGPDMIYIPNPPNGAFMASYNTDYGHFAEYIISAAVITLLILAAVELKPWLSKRH